LSGDCRKRTYQSAPDFRSASRRDNRRIVEPCNCCRNTDGGRKDKQDGMLFDRNRLRAKGKRGACSRSPCLLPPAIVRVERCRRAVLRFVEAAGLATLAEQAPTRRLAVWRLRRSRTEKRLGQVLFRLPGNVLPAIGSRSCHSDQDTGKPATRSPPMERSGLLAAARSGQTCVTALSPVAWPTSLRAQTKGSRPQIPPWSHHLCRLVGADFAPARTILARRAVSHVSASAPLL
jgi:hypothetical protein